MNDRQLAALLNPQDRADDPSTLTPRRSIRQRGDGLLLVVILAVDR